jgi:hypothetical protein
VVIPYRTGIFKCAVFIIWLILFSLLLQRDYFIKPLDSREAIALERDARTEFQGIYFKNSKIGYVETQYLPGDETIQIEQKAFMRLNISGDTHPIDLRLSATLNQDNTLKLFDFDFSSLFYQMKAHGLVEGSRVSFTLDTGNSTIQDHLELKSPPLLSTSRRYYLLHEGIKEGDKIRIPWFDPVSLSSKTSTIEYRGKEQILIHDRVYLLHRFIEHFSGTRVNSWLDDTGNVIKEESPAGFVFIQEPEFKAKALDNVSTDLLSSVAVKITGSMPDNLTELSAMRYLVKLPPDSNFNMNSGRQTFSQDILTLTKESIPESDRETRSSCTGIESELESSPYIQADAAEIIEQSNSITSALTSDIEKAEALATWVYRELDKRPVLGIPDALTTLKNRFGDCNEHASLFAALARAAKIPAKIAAGVVFHKGAFYYHAWNEVCISGDWLSLDTTTAQFPADLSHIKFVEGELREQVQIGSLLGTLEIEPLTREQ